MNNKRKQKRVDYNIIDGLYLPFNILVCGLWMQGTEMERLFDKYRASAEYGPPVYEILHLRQLQGAFLYEYRVIHCSQVTE